jgi:hypothetical protein
MIHLIHFFNYPGVTSARFFAGKYSILYFGFLAGAVLPIIPLVATPQISASLL